MKKIIYSITALSFFMITSCVNDSEDFNNNQDQLYDVPAETLLANAERELSDQLNTPSVNLNPFRFFSQYWAATQYPQESRYDLITRNVPDNLWNNLYRRVLGNLQTAKENVALETLPTGISEADWLVQQKNKTAIIEILQVYTFQILVDTFGDIPYSEALQTDIILPKYDDDAVIYPDLIARLDAALADLDDSQTSFVTGDIINGGDVENWRLFANTLKVKIGINLSDVNSALAKTTIESAVAEGVILTNDQNVTFGYTEAAPFYNPLFANLVANNRNDFVASKTLVDRLNALQDPRISEYFALAPGTTTYVGGINGAANVYANFSRIGDKLKEADFPGMLFDATEVNFYLAEAAARGFTVGDTEANYYNQAIRLSFEFWDVAGVDAYLAKPEVAYATAAGDWKQKIGNQAWIGLFNRPSESWTSYRRLDAPTLVAPSNASAASEGQVPKRFSYPINEQSVNRANLEAASAAIGGNKLQTRVFWDVN